MQRAARSTAFETVRRGIMPTAHGFPRTCGDRLVEQQAFLDVGAAPVDNQRYLRRKLADSTLAIQQDAQLGSKRLSIVPAVLTADVDQLLRKVFSAARHRHQSVTTGAAAHRLNTTPHARSTGGQRPYPMRI
jgi:hypothetical protein